MSRFRLEECLCGGVTVDIEDTIWHFAKRESADRFLVSRGFEQEDEVTDLERLVKADFEANPPYEWEKAMGGVKRRVSQEWEKAIEGLESSVVGPSTVSGIDW